MIRILQLYGGDLLSGARVTLELALAIWGLGIAVGGALGVAAARWRRLLAPSIRIGYATIAAIPVLVILFWAYYPLQEILGIVIPPFITAVGALGLINILFVAELVRSHIVDFPLEYVQAGLVCGLSRRTILRRIQLPILARQILPGLLLTQIGMLHATLFASLISVDELFRIALRINSQEYEPVAIFTALASFYLAICLPLQAVAHGVRARFSRHVAAR